MFAIWFQKILQDDTEKVWDPVQSVHSKRTGVGLETAIARTGQQHQQRTADFAVHAEYIELNRSQCHR